MSYRMLVVEDNAFTANMLQVLFEGLGFQVDAIENGLDVLPYLRERGADIMILDLELPGMTGDKIYRAVREDAQLKHLPIVPFTAHKETRSPDSLPANLIWAEYEKSGKVPDIVFKSSDTGDVKDLNKELVDEVAWKLMKSGKDITPQMAQYYLETRGLTLDELIRKGP